MRLQGKVAFITGAGSGIGRATAKMFAAEGAKVVIAEKSAELGSETADQIIQTGAVALTVQTDITVEESVMAASEEAVRAFGRIDVLFNCAGGSFDEDQPVDRVDLSIWDKTIRLNLLGTFLVCRFVLPTMVKQGGGTIVNTATWGALRGSFPKHVYSASKGGVISLTRSIAGEYTHGGGART